MLESRRMEAARLQDKIGSIFKSRPSVLSTFNKGATHMIVTSTITDLTRFGIANDHHWPKKKNTATPMCERQNGHETVTTIRLIFQIKTSQEKRITLHGKIAGHGMEWNELQPK